MKTKLLSTFLLGCAFAAGAQPMELQVNVKEIGAPIQPTMYGIFFEDINFGADGGLYAELVKNRSFEFDHPLLGWEPFGQIQVLDKNPCFDQNPHYVQLTKTPETKTGTGLVNEGFFGMGFKKGENYRFSVYARNLSEKPVRMAVDLIGNDRELTAYSSIEITDKAWKRYELVLSPNRTDDRGRLRVLLLGDGTVDLDHISLFPEKTWKGRKNGLRNDLAQALADLNPGVFRFPGGCIVEGTTLETRYNWKHSVGPVENRPININRWNYSQGVRRFPDYYQSYGMGFYEMFLLSEDIGAEPLPVISCGLACQFENKYADPQAMVPIKELDCYIQDALDLIEFANGDTTTRWGKLRAEMGHPAPFNMKYLGVGNEQWGEIYVERLTEFLKVLREKHPEIKIVGSSGPFKDGEYFDYLWPEMKRLQVDLVDEHYYNAPSFFYDNAKRYDSYDREGPKVFAGEYAAHHHTRKNNFDAALSEAAFMTGLERNADVVYMATYAPLFAHVEGWQWKPDLIWFDSMKSVKTPNYYVQQLYGQNAGTHVLPLTYEGQPLAGERKMYATAAFDENTNEIILKIVNAGIDNRSLKVYLNGARPAGQAQGFMLQSDMLEAENTIETPCTVVPEERTATVRDNVVELDAPKQSFQVLRIQLQ